MENKEITQLRELKEKLLKQALILRDKLKEREETGSQPLITLNVTLPNDNDEHRETLQSLARNIKYEAKLCEISAQVTGITFKDVDKKWLHDDTYLYTAKVLTKTVSFNLELTITLKDSDNFKIDDIMCYFIGVDDCYMLEISPWFQEITSSKNFSLLMSALSDYNESNILRSKILRNLESKKYIHIEEYTVENGGLLLHIHAPLDTLKNYIVFHWTMKFLELTWCVGHFFTVQSTDIGIEFAQENSVLLKEFCKIGLQKKELLELWDRLCGAVDEYYDKSTKI